MRTVYDDWDVDYRRIKTLLKKDALTQEQIEEIRELIKEAEDFAFEMESRATTIEGEAEQATADLEEWLACNNVIEQINDPSLYDTDLFGNPTRSR